MNQNKKRIYVIINPISGTDSKKTVLQRIGSELSCIGTTLTIQFTEYLGHASILTKQAISEGATCIIAVGGDGTVNEIARTLIHTDVVLGIIPKGSGNGLARELHIPMDSAKAVEIIKQGLSKDIDACMANEKVFFCTCGVGFDAMVSKKFAKEKRRGSLTYLKNTIETYLKFKPEVYELLIDNQRIKEKAFLVACGNASQYGNNAYIAPHADIQDGKIDLTILTPFTYLDIPPLALQLFTKQIDKNSNIRSFRANKLSIIRKKAGIMHLDGESIDAEARIDISVLPKALRVIVPKEVSFTQEIEHALEGFSSFFVKRFQSI